MRPRAYRIVVPTLLAGLVCWVAPALRAEVSMVRGTDNTDSSLLIVSPAAISEDADPIPQLRIRWQMYRSVSLTSVLNMTGDDREDGPPQVAYHRLSNWPVVVWSYGSGPDHDIAFSEWTGNGWSPEQFVTFGAEHERDPRLFVGLNDDIFVVWWVDGTDPRVMISSRSAESTSWNTPVRVSPPGEIVRRPTVAEFEGALRVAYERSSNSGATFSRELVVRRLESVDAFVEEHAITIPRADPLDPVLHVASGQLWMDWKHSPTQFGSSEYGDAGWQPPTLYDWADPSWVGVEGMRHFIRRSLVVLPDIADVGP